MVAYQTVGMVAVLLRALKVETLLQGKQAVAAVVGVPAAPSACEEKKYSWLPEEVAAAPGSVMVV
jgi:hypothetical protein